MKTGVVLESDSEQEPQPSKREVVVRRWQPLGGVGDKLRKGSKPRIHQLIVVVKLVPELKLLF